MAKGDCETAFWLAAHSDGVELVRARVPWLNQRGHFGLPEEASAAVAAMSAIFEALGGNASEMADKRMTALPGDFVHLKTGVFVEVDESQHFTSLRLATLDLYPETTPLGFDLFEYKRLCRELARRSDRYRRDKHAVGFGPGGRQRQRAYNDALRDVVTPAMGYAPVIRVAAPDRDGVAAYASVRSRLRLATGVEWRATSHRRQETLSARGMSAFLRSRKLSSGQCPQKAASDMNIASLASSDVKSGA